MFKVLQSSMTSSRGYEAATWVLKLLAMMPHDSLRLSAQISCQQ